MTPNNVPFLSYAAGLSLLVAFVLLTATRCHESATPTATPVVTAPAPATSQHTQPPSIKAGERIGGLTMVAPPRPFPANPMGPVKAVHANWIAVIPYAFTRPGNATVKYHAFDGKWWGESMTGVAETIRLAHEAGVKTMLKPQVYVPGGWTGHIDFQTEAEWVSWEGDYERYILPMARLADSLDVEMFCIGTEFNNPIQKRTDYWRSLIKKIRAIYDGPLTYSSNWDDWPRVPFWDDLDYIGLSGYYPLVNAATPPVDSLKAAWQPIKAQLKAFSIQHQKPILFTEYGYLTVDNCGWRNWETEPIVKSLPINQQAQANCYEALHATFSPESWWAGGFVWKWFPNGQGHEGYPERDYTPQGKRAESVLAKWHGTNK
jgi:hypothetical protein